MQGKRGFTLIEVLIVVIILGILATIAVPQFGKVVERARFAEVASNLHAVKAALAIYYMEHGKLEGTVETMALAINVDLGTLSVKWDGPDVVVTLGTQNYTITYTRVGGDDTGKTAVYTSSSNLWSGTYPYIPK